MNISINQKFRLSFISQDYQQSSFLSTISFTKIFDIMNVMSEIFRTSIEAERAEFTKVHGKTENVPSFPAMLFAGVINDEKDVKRAEILLKATPRPKTDPKNN